MLKRVVSCLLMVALLVGLIPVAAAASGGPAALTNPDIEPVLHSSGDYVGYYDDEVSYASSLKVRWEDVDADSYNVAIKLLNGKPAPGANEPGTFLYSYTTDYTRTYISLSSSKMESAAGKWVKVFVEAVFGSKTYPCHYYFQVEEIPTGCPAELTNPQIEPVLHSSGDYVGYYDDVVSNASSLKVRWEDVDADSYNVAVKVLSGKPAPGANEPGTFLYSYTTGYTRTYISLSSSKMESAAGKWVKVFVEAVFGSETYPCHYYFQVEADDPMTLDKTSVNLGWEKNNEGSVRISGVDNYDFSIAYDVPSDVLTSSYQYAWLDVEKTGDTLVFTPTRANYAASARTAVVTVVSGAESKTVTVTQSACGEAAPTIQIYRNGTVCSDGDEIGTFILPQEVMELDIVSTNVRKVAADLYNGMGEWLDSCITTSKISLDIANLPAGQYSIVIHASNSDTDNDYWKQSPFAGGSMTLSFRLRDLTVAGSKDFSTYKEASQMIKTAYSDDWSTVGEINYVQQYYAAGYYSDTDDDYLGKGYWASNTQGSEKCTRAAACMALSYMGITAFPKYSSTNHPYIDFADGLGCYTDPNEVFEFMTSEEIEAPDLEGFEAMYARYANDTTGDYSPIVIHTNHDYGQHAFTVFGRDAEDGEYYVVDSGHGEVYHLGKIKLEEVNDEIRVAKYRFIDNPTYEETVLAKYNIGNAVHCVWQYVRKEPHELPDLPETGLELSQTTVNMTWGADNAATVQVSGVNSYRFSVAYDVPADVLTSGYNYAWLDVRDTGSALILTPNRANYADAARTAVVTVTSGSDSKTITVTQAACGEAAPNIKLLRNSEICTDGSILGYFPIPAESLEISIASSNVRKVAAYLMDAQENTLAECMDIDGISFDISGLPAGTYKIIVYASNSDTANDYWKQSPFAGGFATLRFEVLAENIQDPEAPGKGDLNLDGQVNSDDLTLLARHVGGIETVNGQALKNADVNGDGLVNSDDLTRHARYVGGIITTWDQE